MAFGDKKAGEARTDPKPDSKDEVRVSEQLLIVKAATTKEQLDAIAAADRRPGVQIAIRARRDELDRVLEVAEQLLKGGRIGEPSGPEGLKAHEQARMVARDNPPAGKSGKSCARCAHRMSIPRTYSTVNCEKIHPGSRITVGTETAERCGEYSEVEV